MRNAAIVFVVLSGCSGVDMPTGRAAHAEVACEPPQGAEVCEAACVGSDADLPGSCRAKNPSVSGTFSCFGLREFDSIQGCCLPVGSGEDVVIRYFECD